MPVEADYCIIGGGAVGVLTAYYIYRGDPGARIAVFYRSKEAAEIVANSRGVWVEVEGGRYHVPVEPYVSGYDSVICNYIINAVKAVDLPGTIGFMKKLRRGREPVLSLQNGFGSLEAVEEAFPDHCVAGGVVYFSGERVNYNYVRHNGGNGLVVGGRRGLCLELEGLVETLRKGGCDARLVSDIDFYRWLKLALNSVVNPLTAIARARNKIVLLDSARPLVEAILDEVVEAASVYGVKLDKNLLVKHVLAGAGNTRENYSSMAQDIMRGRKTEVDYINGYIARILESRGKKLNLNRLITMIVHMIEDYYGEESHG
ncbi:ketopantoate reductase family protein [Thermogladius sp. 4427co]|uniref:ketopantoate reductase family protein n=1 Tax=Thermogladius sp. 4427co TaxID=3450718 RepID=UPI003F78DF35